MRNTKVLAAAIGMGFSLAGGAIAAPASQKGFDGTWSVQMVTDSGICSRSYNYAIAINRGSVRYIQAPGDSPTTVVGQVDPEGSVDLDIMRGPVKVDAQGRLGTTSGSGSWRLGMIGCSGRWTAQRRAGGSTTASVQ